MFNFSLNPKVQAVDSSSLCSYYLQFLLQINEATAVLQETWVPCIPGGCDRNSRGWSLGSDTN